MPCKYLFPILLALLIFGSIQGNSIETEIWENKIAVIPYPQQVNLNDNVFIFNKNLKICLDQNSGNDAQFTAEELQSLLKEKFNVKSEIVKGQTSPPAISFKKENLPDIPKQGYILEVNKKQVVIKANDQIGLFYGVQTFVQLIKQNKSGLFVKGMNIKDWPDIPIRAVHYDTKHFQENKEYVKNFIRTLSHYKINMLIWEWEDKFEYKSHPEVGAPGAFTFEEMHELTTFAKKYHIQIVPLVQGLGHVSFILKHPENKHLREIPSNNWGFCPLREGTYNFMTDLLEEAIEATPGSEYIHIGCDETYTLGKGVACGCKIKAEAEGKNALRQVYVNRVAEIVKKMGRKPISWAGGYDVNEKVKPVEGLMTPGGFNEKNDSASIANNYPLYIYDPNPGIEHLFLPYFYRERFDKQIDPHLERSYNELTKASKSGKYEGMISTSWNCSGVHNQIWMLRYITAAEYSWNGANPKLDEFTDKYFVNYYGPQSSNVKELFIELSKASYFYMSTFERKVWHWGEIGKTHLPDLPRGDIEYDPYWNKEYAGIVKKSKEMIPHMDRVLDICSENKAADSFNSYDFEIFEGLANLFKHTAQTYLTLSELETQIEKAHKLHFNDNEAAIKELSEAVSFVEANLKEREVVFNYIKTTWEKWQLSRGMSTADKKYVHGRDQQRNFANRRPDLSFMIYDEQLLDLETYLEKFKKYVDWYKTKYIL